MKFCLIEFCLDPGQRVDLNIIAKVGLKDGRQKAKKKKSRSLSSIIIIIFILISTWKISSSFATLRCSRRCLINLKAISKPWKKSWCPPRATECFVWDRYLVYFHWLVVVAELELPWLTDTEGSSCTVSRISHHSINQPPTQHFFSFGNKIKNIFLKNE